MEYTAMAEQLTQLHTTYWRALERGNLAPRGESAVKLCLYLARRPMLSGELGEQTGLTTGRVANLLNKMEEKGQVIRFSDQTDRRRVYVALTEEGFAAAEEGYRTAVAVHRAFLEYLGEADAPEFLRLLEKSLRFYDKK